MLFAAEWGDLSQLLTISMIAKYGHPLSVFVGAWAALLVVSGLAVLVGPRAAALREALGDPLPRRRGVPGRWRLIAWELLSGCVARAERRLGARSSTRRVAP